MSPKLSVVFTMRGTLTTVIIGLPLFVLTIACAFETFVNVKVSIISAINFNIVFMHLYLYNALKKLHRLKWSFELE